MDSSGSHQPKSEKSLLAEWRPHALSSPSDSSIAFAFTDEPGNYNQTQVQVPTEYLPNTSPTDAPFSDAFDGTHSPNQAQVSVPPSSAGAPVWQPAATSSDRSPLPSLRTDPETLSASTSPIPMQNTWEYRPGDVYDLSGSYTPSYASLQSAHSSAGSNFGSPLTSTSFPSAHPSPFLLPDNIATHDTPLFSSLDWSDSQDPSAEAVLDERPSSVGLSDNHPPAPSDQFYSPSQPSPEVSSGRSLVSQETHNLSRRMQDMTVFGNTQGYGTGQRLPPERDDTIRPNAAPVAPDESSMDAQDQPSDPPFFTERVFSDSPTNSRPASPEAMDSQNQMPHSQNIPQVQVDLHIPSSQPQLTPDSSRQLTAGTMEMDRIFESLVQNQYNEQQQTLRAHSAEPGSQTTNQGFSRSGDKKPQRQRSHSESGIFATSTQRGSGVGIATEGNRTAQPNLMSFQGSAVDPGFVGGTDVMTTQQQQVSSTGSNLTSGYDSSFLMPNAPRQYSQTRSGTLKGHRLARSEDLSLYTQQDSPAMTAPGNFDSSPTRDTIMKHEERSPAQRFFAAGPDWRMQLAESMGLKPTQASEKGSFDQGSSASPERERSHMQVFSPGSVVSPDGRSEISDVSESGHPIHWQSQTTRATKYAADSRRKLGAEAKFVCKYCGSTFTRAYNLKGHVRAHMNEKPYACKVVGCGKSFARAHDLKRHTALHYDVSKYKCGACGRAFKRRDALQRHHKSENGQICISRLIASGEMMPNEAEKVKPNNKENVGNDFASSSVLL